MAIGVPDTEVFAAADRVLARGERPTVERVRAELGRGSPARVGQLLEQWWDKLAKRIAGETRLPELPPEAATAFKAAWTIASDQAMTIAEERLAAGQLALKQGQATLAEERSRWSTDLDSARAAVALAQDAQTTAEQRLIDHQRLVEQLQVESRDVKVQRDKLQEQVDILARDLIRLNAKLEKQEKDHAAERMSTAAHVRAIEDRAHAEVDRARTEIKTLRTMLTQAERAGQEARDTAAREQKEHVVQLRDAEREAATQRARAEALEEQLSRWATMVSPSTTVTAGSRKKFPDPLAKLRKDFEALIVQMRMPQAPVEIDELAPPAGPSREAMANVHRPGPATRKDKRKVNQKQ